METGLEALFNYVTPVTLAVALFLPSIWMSAALGVVMAMIGVIVLSPGTPSSDVVASWLVAQTAVAVVVTFIRRKAM